jgi:hypothetical protein
MSSLANGWAGTTIQAVARAADVDPALKATAAHDVEQRLGAAALRRKIEPIASMSADEVLAAMTPNLQRFIDGDLAERVNVDSASRL